MGSGENYQEDIRLSKEILTRLADAYRKARNTIRFLLGNLAGFSPERELVVDGVGRPADWTDIVVSGVLFDASGDLRTHLKNEISRFVQRVASRDPAERYRIAVRAAIATQSATGSGWARATG